MICKISIDRDAGEVTPEAAADGNAPTAASDPLRSLEWYLDGRSAGSNAAGANVEIVSTEYTGHGVVIGLVDEGFHLRQRDLVRGADRLRRGRDDAPGGLAARRTASAHRERFRIWVTAPAFSPQEPSIGAAPMSALGQKQTSDRSMPDVR
jgi:hypothetical protein